MKALTILQPWAHLIAFGAKRVENRSWITGYRGPLVIHAGKSDRLITERDRELYPAMAFGAIVAVAELVECVRLGELNVPPWVVDHA